MASKPTQDQIDQVLNACSVLTDANENPYFGMTYTQGVEDGINWVLGYIDAQPFDDEQGAEAIARAEEAMGEREEEMD